MMTKFHNMPSPLLDFRVEVQPILDVSIRIQMIITQGKMPGVEMDQQMKMAK